MIDAHCQFCGGETDTTTLADMAPNIMTEFIGWFCYECGAAEYYTLYNTPEKCAEFPDRIFLPDTVLYIFPWDH